MGIQRDYLRLTLDELRRALSDPIWAGARLDELGESWDDEKPEQARFLSVDKSWPGIELALASVGLPVETINGTEELPTGDEWDYGFPTYLTPAEVAAVAQRLVNLPVTEIVNSVDAEAVRARKLYVVGAWTDKDRDYVAHHAEQLKSFYAAAAKAGDAVVAMLT